MNKFGPVWVMVKFFNIHRGYGFFTGTNGRDIHFHEHELVMWGFSIEKCVKGVPALVSYEQNTETGRLRVTMVHRIGMWERPELVGTAEEVLPIIEPVDVPETAVTVPLVVVQPEDVVSTGMPTEMPKKQHKAKKPKLSGAEQLIVKRTSRKKIPDTGMAAAFCIAAQTVQARVH